jgi:2,3-bisphosphoglycerate-independent phosphoglycerate mutase
MRFCPGWIPAGTTCDLQFCESDMVGHTGVLEAAVIACKTVDACVGKIVDKTLALGGSAVILADHGNFERMWDTPNKMPHTAHTVGDVPLIVVDDAFKGRKMTNGRLADVVPTFLEVMGLPVPAEMTEGACFCNSDKTALVTAKNGENSWQR